MINITDNFLTEDEFNILRGGVLSNDFPFYINTGIVENNDVSNNPIWELKNNTVAYTHVFYSYGKPNSNFFDLLQPILNKIEPTALLRIKCNLYSKTEKIVEHGYHVDFDHNLENSKTSLFYLNTNNGYTKFEDGTVVESLENRFVTFSTNLRHTSSSCTDKQIRSNINFNYYKETI